MYVPIEVRIKICCALVVTHVLLLHLRENNQCLSKCGSALTANILFLVINEACRKARALTEQPIMLDFLFE